MVLGHSENIKDYELAHCLDLGLLESARALHFEIQAQCLGLLHPYLALDRVLRAALHAQIYGPVHRARGNTQFIHRVKLCSTNHDMDINILLYI